MSGGASERASSFGPQSRVRRDDLLRQLSRSAIFGHSAEWESWIVVDAHESVHADSADGAVTATLGNLYLDQGHLDEAERIFNSVLMTDPRHQGALEGLDRLARARREVSAGSEGRVETSAPAGASERVVSAGGRRAGRIDRLERFLERVQRHRQPTS